MISDRDFLLKLGPTGRAFFGRFNRLREVQRYALLPVLSGMNVLLTSATASGKTEALLAPMITRILSSNTAAGKSAIRLLAVAPTRALVNDLHARLEGPLSELNWLCGRQTSDHGEKSKCPHVLITTPESFDSMLVRGDIREDGRLVGHLLSEVVAVFIDEAHLFESSARGDQVAWMLARLRRLREYACRCGWAGDGTLHICAASATVEDPESLARKLLGSSHEVIQVPGNREVELLTQDDADRWANLESLCSVQDIYDRLPRANGPGDLDSLVRHIWRAIEKGAFEGTRKVLVFVPSRSLCDKLSAKLKNDLRQSRDLYVSGHHGSLERIRREDAEKQFAIRRDAVLVATTTLEVGVDIGDVDVVALIGCPPNTSSLLQRIGRAGRRSGLVRIIPIARDEQEARAFSSMIDTAFQGVLDCSSQGCRWSVFVQQAASHIAQTKGKGRSRRDLESLAEEVWPASNKLLAQTIEWLLQQGTFVQSGDFFYLGEEFSDRLRQGGGAFHCNFASDAGSIPVIDSSTGDVIAHVAGKPQHSGSVALAGQQWEVMHECGEILLRPTHDASEKKTFRYACRSTPCGKNYAEHIRRGMGLEPDCAPLVQMTGGLVWFHFGGAAYEVLLRKLFRNLRVFRSFVGLAVLGKPDESKVSSILKNPGRISEEIDESTLLHLESVLSLGKYHHLLPCEVRKTVVLDILDFESFVSWLQTRHLIHIDREQDAYQEFLALMASE